jgi:hypothetical protein
MFCVCSSHPPCDDKHFGVELISWHIGVGMSASFKTYSPWVLFGGKFALQIPRSQIRTMEQSETKRLKADYLVLFGEGILKYNPIEGVSLTVTAGLIANDGWHQPFGLPFTVYHFGALVGLSSRAAELQHGIPISAIGGFGKTMIGKTVLELKFKVSLVKPSTMAFEGTIEHISLGDIIHWLHEQVKHILKKLSAKLHKQGNQIQLFVSFVS